MKIELVEENNPGTGTMYQVSVEGNVIKWFAHKDAAEAYYNSVIANPSLLKPVKNILKSEEIKVSLEEETKTNI